MYFERRMCDFTARPIAANDRSSVQILLAELDTAGRMTENVEIIDICGSIRENGQCDALLLEHNRSKLSSQ
ncbi:small subunit ribosomal protein S21e [Pancytospora philotis]|nr:small subunit ribosomal protein S21e [Pancytospora philotis]